MALLQRIFRRGVAGGQQPPCVCEFAASKKRGQPLAARNTQSPPRISLRPGIKPAEGLCKCLVDLSSRRGHFSPRPTRNDNRIMTNVFRLSISCGDPEAALINCDNHLHFFGRRCAHFPSAGMIARIEHQQRILEPGSSRVTKDSSEARPLHSLRCLTTLRFRLRRLICATAAAAEYLQKR